MSHPDNFINLHYHLASLPGVIRKRHHEVEFAVQQRTTNPDEKYYATSATSHTAVDGQLKVQTLSLKTPCRFCAGESITGHNLKTEGLIVCGKLYNGITLAGRIKVPHNANEIQKKLLKQEIKGFKRHLEYLKNHNFTHGQVEHYYRDNSDGTTALGLCLRVEGTLGGPKRIVEGFIIIEALSATEKK